MNVELVVDAKATLGEGAIWDARRQRLLWVNIVEGEVHAYNPADDTDQAVEVGQAVGTVVPRRGGGLMLALEHGFASFDLETHELTIINDPEQDLPDNRFNDGKCDPAGRFWAGTMSADRTPVASLYRMDADHTVQRVLGGVTVSNGIAWSLDQSTMYYIDTPTRQVDAFDFDVESGQITNRRVVITVPEQAGKPDGMTIDAEGKLWIAMWDGSRITRWDPSTGRLEQTIPIPARKVTSCAFGGEHLDDLYVTTARNGMTETELRDQPHAGGVFRVRPGVRGVEAFEFAG